MCANNLFLLGYFGEGPVDRRERLRHLLARLGQDAIKKRKEDERVLEEKVASGEVKMIII